MNDAADPLPGSPTDDLAPAGSPGEVRALRVGLLAGALFFAASVGWDTAVAPDHSGRLLVIRGFGILAMASVGGLSAAFPQRSVLLGVLASALAAMTVSAAVVVLPYGFGYGIGGLLFVALAAGLVFRDGRSVAAAGAASIVVAAVTLAGYRAPLDTGLAMAFFALPGFTLATWLGHSTHLRRDREQQIRVQLQALQEDLQRFGSNDELTGVHGRKQLAALARREISLARRRKSTLSALIIDVVELARINERYGRDAGDETLRAVASMCQGALRETDLLARVGGDEFAAVLPEADEIGARTICDRLHAKLAKASVLAGDQVLQVTINVATSTLVESDKGIEDLLKRADEALQVRRKTLVT